MPDLGVERYYPQPTPKFEDVEQVQRYVNDELVRIAELLREIMDWIDAEP